MPLHQNNTCLPAIWIVLEEYSLLAFCWTCFSRIAVGRTRLQSSRKRVLSSCWINSFVPGGIGRKRVSSQSTGECATIRQPRLKTPQRSQDATARKYILKKTLKSQQPPSENSPGNARINAEFCARLRFLSITMTLVVLKHTRFPGNIQNKLKIHEKFENRNT